MNEKLDNEQTLRNYLLDALPAAETERIDELAFTDEDFAARLKAAENDLIDAYLHNELTDKTLEKFKSYYLSSPRRREKVAFAQIFQNFAERDLNNQAALSPAQTTEPQPKSFFRLSNFFARPSALGWSLAAAGILLLVLAGFWIFSRKSNRQETEIAEKSDVSNQNLSSAVSPAVQNSENTNVNRTEMNVQPTQTPVKTETTKPLVKETPPTPQSTPIKPLIASFVLAPSLRGESNLKNISISKQTTDAAFRLQLESTDYSAYRVVLTDQSSGKNIWSSGVIKTNSRGENKFLNVRFPARLLKPQIYSLEVSGVNLNGETEIVGDYPFRVVLQ